jgi:hypothetical protein
MGNFFQVIVDRDATEFEAADLARSVHALDLRAVARAASGDPQ